MNGADKKNVANEEEEEEVMENGLHLTLTHSHTPLRPIIASSSSSSLFLQFNNTHFRFTSRRLRFSFTLINYAKWDSNADILRARNFTFNFDPDDDGQEEEDDDDDDEGFFSGNVKKKKKKKNREWWSKKYGTRKKKSTNWFEEVVESILILKVFKSYGWLLPAIIISFLLATGPKAFLMAFTLSLGLSALSLAFEKLQRKLQRRPKNKTRMRRKTSYSNATSVEMNEEEREESHENENKKMSEFWVGSDNGSVRKGSEDSPSFGGWDDHLDGAGSMRRKSTVTGGSRRRREEKLSGSGRNSESPLLLRLLVAVFPFISSWAEMFW
ncbi:hypothetical protein Ddye_018999 [Dipteronia dyeriana]|uniref:Transmembrane protein n=1 Tax=Dipteronia dyeriana TaxID=168575 RepID=A0AAD9TY12_9ROSI|nr:hypothetical protein Ddye_018999 [Dipteronia dyeriana]